MFHIIFFIDIIRKEPTLIVSKLLFLLLVRVVIYLDFLLSALFFDASIVRFYKVVVAALKSVIVLNNTNFEMGLIRHNSISCQLKSFGKFGLYLDLRVCTEN